MNNRPDKPEGIKNLRKYLGLPENNQDNQADWPTELLRPYKEAFTEASYNRLRAAITTKIAEERQAAIIEFLKAEDNVSRDEMLASLEAALKEIND